MVRHVLSEHPDLAIGPETHFLGTWLERFPRLLDADAATFEEFFAEFTADPGWHRFRIERDELYRRATAGGVPDARTLFGTIMSIHARRLGKPRVGEKTPNHFAHLDRILEWYPDARIVFMVRDPRAVLASVLTLEREWAHETPMHWASVWVSTIDHLDRVRDDQRVRVVKYEHLVADPETELASLLEFLDLEPVPGFGAVRSDDAKGTFAYASLNPRGVIRAGSVDRWREVLSGGQIADVECIARRHMLREGYTPVRRRTPPLVAARWFVWRAAGWAATTRGAYYRSRVRRRQDSRPRA